MNIDQVFIYGKHAVLEAIKKRPDVVSVVYVHSDLVSDSEVSKCLSVIGNHEMFSGNNTPKGVEKSAVHQGIIAKIDVQKLVIPFKKFIDNLKVDDRMSLVLLGEVHDPHNVGAIIRSAAAFGVSGVLIPEHRSCPVTGTVIKVSAGTAFSIPIAEMGNVNSSIRSLKEIGFWVYGLDGSGEASLHTEKFTKPSAFVVGNEASGIRLKTHELCDTMLNIPMDDKAESLNASVSAAVVLYEWSSQKTNLYQK